MVRVTYMGLCRKRLHGLDDPTVAYITPVTGVRSCGSCRRDRARKWYAANLERARANDRARDPGRHHHRRARIAQVLSTLTPQEWQAILKAAGHACIYCGSGEKLAMDHLVPISRGGDHTAANVAPACKSCNSSKGAQAIADFLSEGASTPGGGS